MGKKKRARKSYGRSGSASTSQISRNRIIALILGVTFLAFANSLFNGFAYDDTTQILENPFIRDLSNIPTAMVTEAWFWRAEKDKDPNEQRAPTTPYYRPMIMIYFMLVWSVFQHWAFMWHLANLLMHLTVVYFVFLVLEKVTGNLRLTAIASLLFAVHPLRSESVAWISGLTDLFLAVFLVPSFYLYLLYRESKRLKHIAMSLLLFLFGTFSKEPAVCLPIFIAAYELLIANREQPIKQKLRPALTFSGIYLVGSVVYFGMRQYALGFLLNDANYTSYAIAQILLTIPLVVCKYIGLLVWPFWPTPLSLFHSTPLVMSPLDIRFILPFLALLALAILLWPLRESLIARFAILWFVINLLPVLNLSAFAVDFMVQERYMYIPSIGFSLLVAMGLVNLPFEKWLSVPSRRAAQYAAVGLIVLLMTGRTLAQNGVWKDDLTLWIHGSQAAPDQPMPHFILGHKYFNLQQYDKVVESLEKYVEVNPENTIVLTNLAASHLLVYERTLDRTHVDRAVVLAEKGLRIDEGNDALWDTLGRAYVLDTDLKNYTRAHYFFDRGLAVSPENAMLHFHKGATYAKQDMQEAALMHLERARQLQPDLPDTYKFLAYSYLDKGQVQEAIKNLDHYLKLQPNALDAPRINQDLQRLRAQLQAQTAAPKT